MPGKLAYKMDSKGLFKQVLYGTCSNETYNFDIPRYYYYYIPTTTKYCREMARRQDWNWLSFFRSFDSSAKKKKKTATIERANERTTQIHTFAMSAKGKEKKNGSTNR